MSRRRAFRTSYQVGSALGLAAVTAIAVAASDGSSLAALNDGYQAAFFGAAALAAAAALLAVIAIRSPSAHTARARTRPRISSRRCRNGKRPESDGRITTAEAIATFALASAGAAQRGQCICCMCSTIAPKLANVMVTPSWVQVTVGGLGR